MVIDGRVILRRNVLVAEFDGERIYLPSQIVENAEQPRLAGEEPLECWLLVVTPGRYRLVARPPGAPAGDLSRILSQIEEVTAPGDVLDRTQNNARDGIPARLIPCRVTPPKPGWRINLPKEAMAIIPHTEDHSFVFVMIVAGFIEIWFPDTLRRALSGPIREILP